MSLSEGRDPKRDQNLQPSSESPDSSDVSEPEERLARIEIPPAPTLPPPPEIHFRRPDLGSAQLRKPDSQPGFKTTYRIGDDRPRGVAPKSGAQDAGSYGAELGAGITFAASVVVGFLIGAWLDHKLHLAFPWGTIILGFAGIAAGFINLFRLLAMKDRHNRKG